MTLHARPPEPLLVAGSHRHIRMLDAQESPFAGALVRVAENTAVLRPVEELAGWDGWRFAGADHVAGPLDVVRRADGHDALLPWCTERVVSFLARRRLAAEELSAGEIGTIVGSMLRGLDEIGELDGGPASSGDWWLTDQGRPVFVIGAGDSARDGAADVVDRMQSSRTDRALVRVLTTISEGLAQPRVPRRLAQGWEDELFTIASPQPLRREVFSPERARDVAPRREPVLDESRVRQRRTLRTVIAHHGERLVQALERVRTKKLGYRRERARAAQERAQPRQEADAVASVPSASKRRRIIVAGAAAAAVLGIGLLWPTGDAETADAGTESVATGAAMPESPGDDADTETDAASGTSGDAASDEGEATTEEPAPTASATSEAAAAEKLVSGLVACRAAADAVCAGVAEDTAGDLPKKLAFTDPDEITLTLVDEYGDIAVFRASHISGEDAEQMLVLVRANENWLVRDIYDIANQPA